MKFGQNLGMVLNKGLASWDLLYRPLVYLPSSYFPILFNPPLAVNPTMVMLFLLIHFVNVSLGTENRIKTFKSYLQIFKIYTSSSGSSIL